MQRDRLMKWAGFIWMCSLASMCQGLILIYNGRALPTTPLAILDGFFHQNHLIVASLLIVAGACGFFAVKFHKPSLLGPQHFILVLGAFSALRAIHLGQYPNGHAPIDARAFIASDQLRVILVAVMYSVAMVTQWGPKWISNK